MTGLGAARRNVMAYAVACYLLVFAVATAGVGTGLATRPVVAAVLGVATGAVMLVGIQRHRPPTRWPWWLLVVSVVTFASSRYAPPAVADTLYLGVVFPTTAIGLTALGRRGADGIRTLDALTVSAGLAVLSWVLLIAPVLRTSDLTVGSMVVGVARPLADIVMLACMVRTLLGTRLRPAGVLLCTGMLALIVGELLTDQLTDDGLWSGGTEVRWLGAVFCGLWGLGTAHPSMAALSTPGPERRLLGRGRLVLLAVSSLTAPGVLLVEGVRSTVDDPQVIAVSSAVLFLLVLTRLAGVLTVHRQTAARERALRAAAAALLTTTSREGVFDAVRTAVSRLLPPGTPHEVVLGDAVPASPEPSTDGVVRIPVPVRDGTEVSLTVTAAEETLTLLGDALQVLASHAALALARVSLNGEVNHRRSEEYFRTLVQNASDVILIIDDDDRIRYASPSAARLFGATPPVGHAVTELTSPISRDLAIRYLQAARAGGLPQPDEPSDDQPTGTQPTRPAADRIAGRTPSPAEADRITGNAGIPPGAVEADRITGNASVAPLDLAADRIIGNAGGAVPGDLAADRITGDPDRDPRVPEADRITGNAGDAATHPDGDAIAGIAGGAGAAPTGIEADRIVSNAATDPGTTEADRNTSNAGIASDPSLHTGGIVDNAPHAPHDAGRIIGNAGNATTPQPSGRTTSNASNGRVTGHPGRITSNTADRSAAGAGVGTPERSGIALVPGSRTPRVAAGPSAGAVGAIPANLLPAGDWQVGALPTGDGRIVEPIEVEVSVRDLRDDPTVGGLVLTMRDVTEPRRLERELTHHAFSDALTGLANRALFQERLKQALARAERNGTVVAVLCADFDDFAIINDTIGHEAGDQLVIAAGRRIGTLVEPHATVARSGGDEFSVLVEDVTSARDVEQIAERIVSGFAEPFRLAAGTVSGAVSVGVAVAGDSESAIRIDDPTALVREADLALYLAKGAGKGRWRRFQASLHAHMRERLELRADLDRALADQAFELYYQPIVDLPTGRALGFEALLRWPHPTRGFVPPDRFIGIAEESGQIVAIGSMVLERALDTAAVWRDRDGPDAPYVSVNVSARQFRTPGFVDRVMRGLASRHLPARSLVLEITESLLLRDADGVLADLASLREEGVRIAIDDFGTGYSSLSYLRQVPADLLKIDKSFVDTVVASKEQRALVEAIVTLAHTLGLRVVVEGIERPDERALLTALGCEYGQGYHFSRPMSYADVNRWIAVDRVAA